MKEIPLKATRNSPARKRIALLLGIVLGPLVAAHAADPASLLGEVADMRGGRLNGARIEITSEHGGMDSVLLHSDAEGRFAITGLEPGEYALQVELAGYRALHQNFILEEGRSFQMRIALASEDGGPESRGRFIPIDGSSSVQETILDEHHIHDMPSAHNLWALLENQDLSATSSRIDIGGLWSGLPAVFSARGGTSWTQTVYQLNGMEVSDPYRSGMPLFYPDFYSLRSIRLINAAAPAFVLTPGGQLDLTPFEGTDEFHGGLSAFYIHHSLQSSNITPALESEGIFESHGFDYFMDGNIHASGPILPGRMTYFASLTAFDLSRDLADSPEAQTTSLLSGLVNLKYRLPGGSLHMLWTGQRLGHPSYGAGRAIPFSATHDRSERFQVVQALWKARFHPRHAFDLGVSYSLGDITADFQEGVVEPYGVEVFSEIPTGSAPHASDDRRTHLTVQLKGESLLSGFWNTRHRVQYGLRFRRGTASSLLEIRDDLHLRFYNGDPLEIIRYNTPLEHRESARHWSAWLQDSITLPGGLTFYAGAHFAWSRGRPEPIDGGAAGETIEWRNLAPRAGIIIPLNRARTAAFKFAYSRYFYSLPLNNLTYGHPDALGGLVYSWEDRNQDGRFQTGEAGQLLRREGPFYGAIDSELERPVTDEFLLSYITTFGDGWTFSLSGFGRNTSRLVRRINTGVTFDDYDPVYITDTGDDRIPFSYDDLLFTVFDQKPGSLGRDFFLLGNIPNDTRTTVSYGFDLNLIKRFGRRFTFFLSLTATQADGAGHPGNSEWENDDGVIGGLFDNPNALINAVGRMRFDRAYTGRLGLHYRAPYGFNLSFIIKYYDGIPFSRKIIVEGLNQGPIFIQAHPRGVARYEYNRTVDIRLEKILRSGRHNWRLMIDAFNLFNLHQATEENEWTRPEFPLRYATEIQSPRVVRIGLSYEF